MNEQIKIPEFNEEDKREASFHNFDENEMVVGQLIEISEGIYGNQYLIKDAETGKEITIGTYEALKSKITSNDLNKFVKIICKGNQVSPKTKRTYKDFDVFVKEIS